MPTYIFKDTNTGEQAEYILRMSEIDQFKANNPHLSQVIGTSNFVRDSGRMKPDDNFRDVLKSIKKASGRNNTINTW